MVENNFFKIKCRKCLTEKEEVEFPSYRLKQGNRICKLCNKLDEQEYHERRIAENPNYCKENYRKYLEKNPDFNKKNYEQNKEKHKESVMKYREKNAEKIREYSRKHYYENKNHYSQKNKEWRLKNPEKVKEKRKKHSLKPEAKIKAKEASKRKLARKRAETQNREQKDYQTFLDIICKSPTVLTLIIKANHEWNGRRKEKLRQRYWEKRDGRHAKMKEYRSRSDIKEKRRVKNSIKIKENNIKKWNNFISTITKFPIILKILTHIYYWKKDQKNMADQIRSRIRSGLKAQNVKKSQKTEKIIGCSFLEFKKHIESLFKDGMQWSNNGLGPGTWQLEHKLPVCSFNLADPEQQKQCFSYLNTRPMWFEDHVQKTLEDRNKYVYKDLV